jgi:hypothetical protein
LAQRSLFVAALYRDLDGGARRNQRAVWGHTADGRDRAIRFLPFLIGVSYFFGVMAVYPAEGFIIPLYVLLLPYAALGLWWTTAFLVPPEEE